MSTPAQPDAQALAVVLEQPEDLVLTRLELTPPTTDDVVVDVTYSGISTGTERLLWTGEMPPFPGMGYPLVPGYETVGQIVEAGPDSGHAIGETVFVPGAQCYGEVRGLFGGASSKIVLPGTRAITLPSSLDEKGVMIALAATAQHAIAGSDALPDLIVGHGVLGRLIARLAVQAGGTPVVWETNKTRQDGDTGYDVVHPDDDPRTDYQCIFDVSGDAGLLDSLIGRIAKGGEIVLAGFYHAPLSFAFPPAFMKEARIRVAAEWQPQDLDHVLALTQAGLLSFDGLITHCHDATEAKAAYRTAFDDASCLKMILDWRTVS